MSEYLDSILNRDPAAKSKLSIILTYPGVKAVFFYKIANFFSLAKFDLIAKMISQLSRSVTLREEVHSQDQLIEGPKLLCHFHFQLMLCIGAIYSYR